MSEIIIKNKRKILRLLFGTLSFSTALFVFQACYGTNKDFGRDVLIKGCVRSKTNEKPLAGIRVSITNMPQYTYTDSKGQFQMFGSSNNSYHLIFEDTTAHPLLASVDTTVFVKKTAPFFNIFINDRQNIQY